MELEVHNSTTLTCAEFRNIQNISVENLRKNNGTLKYSFYEMIEILHKDLISPAILTVTSPYEMVAYCMYYWNEDNDIHISHICVKPEYHHHGIGLMMICELENLTPRQITADVYYDNPKGKGLFEKAGFEFTENPAKQRWRVTKKFDYRHMEIMAKCQEIETLRRQLKELEDELSELI